MVTRVSGAESWLLLNDAPLSFRPGDENLDAKAVEYGRNYLRITSVAPPYLEIVIDDEILQTERYGYWIWQPRGFAGLYKLQVRAPNHRTRTALVRVLPSKLSYRRYIQMLEDISAISEDLLFALNSPAAEKATFTSSGERPPSAFREYELVKHIVHDLAIVMSHIRRSPYRTLAQKTEKRLLHEIHQFSSDLVLMPGPTWRLPDVMVGSWGAKQLPAEWLVQENVLTYDVYENRLLKHFLWHQLLARVISIQDQATNEIERRKRQRETKLRQGWDDDETPKINELERIKSECQAMARQCIAWGSEPFLQTVSHLTIGARPTQVLQKHPHYSRFYRIYLHFQQELGLSLNIERYVTYLSLNKMSQLYETWSVFQLTHLILGILTQAGYRVVSSRGFFEVQEEGFTFDVQRNAGIELAKDGLQVRIIYEPVYKPEHRVRFGLVSRGLGQLTPDLAVEVWHEGEVHDVLIFDAKYRSKEDGDRQVYLEEDRDKMDRYANSIRWKTREPRPRLRRAVSSAYILYPGNVLEHDSYDPEVGALPLIPQMTQPRELGQVVVQLLRSARLL